VEFPVTFNLGPWVLHPHPIFETLGYLIGFRVYLTLRARDGDVIDKRTRIYGLIAAISGAALGSKLLFWSIDPALSIAQWNNAAYIMGGKTIVGALIGGLICVELTKKALGVTVRTGDLYALPLCIGIAIGRIGCFLSGLEDDTYGIATTLPWGIDFGDGIARHPTQLYEIGAVLLIGLWVLWRRRRPYVQGDLFLGFLLLYLGWRLGVEFLKPGVFWWGLTSIQWACLLALLFYAPRVPRVFAPPPRP
jgi:phosphatidylglycerol:prolipoprotein diacylglycerol transferase